MLNKRGKIASVLFFLLFDTYANIPHKKPFTVLNYQTDFHFGVGDDKFISFNQYEARWMKTATPKTMFLINECLKEAIKYLLENFETKSYCHYCERQMGIETGIIKPTYGKNSR